MLTVEEIHETELEMRLKTSQSTEFSKGNFIIDSVYCFRVSGININSHFSQYS